MVLGHFFTFMYHTINFFRSKAVIDTSYRRISKLLGIKKAAPEGAARRGMYGD